MADEQTVTVSLPQARVFRGRAYGPGREVPIPARVARAWGMDGGPTGKAAGAKVRKVRKPGK